jgi:hypothetical protein
MISARTHLNSPNQNLDARFLNLSSPAKGLISLELVPSIQFCVKAWADPATLLDIFSFGFLQNQTNYLLSPCESIDTQNALALGQGINRPFHVKNSDANPIRARPTERQQTG